MATLDFKRMCLVEKQLPMEDRQAVYINFVCFVLHGGCGSTIEKTREEGGDARAHMKLMLHL